MASPQDPRKMVVTWQEFSALACRLASRIARSGWQFDNIICITRGGMHVGDPLSRILDKPLGTICASSYRKDGGQTQEELYLAATVSIKDNRVGPRVLVVDDLLDSGKTMVAVKNFLLEKYPGVELRTAVIWEKLCSVCHADYYVDVVSANTWIFQPFEVYDKGHPDYIDGLSTGATLEDTPETTI